MKYVLLLIVAFWFCACAINPQVVIQTAAGDIVIEIFEKEAPITASNFLKLVDEKIYDDAVFYRVVTLANQNNSPVKIEVVQGGLFHDELVDVLAAIPHETTRETGILHHDGIISMARLEPGTASSEFFICIGDQPELNYGGKRNHDAQGFAAFGKVVRGMDVIKKIHAMQNTNQMLNAMVKIKSIRRI